MGIQKFNILFKDIIKQVEVCDLRNKLVVIDANNLLNRQLIGSRNRGCDITDKLGRNVGHIIVIFKFVLNLLKYDINPIFVFDGKPSNLKLSTLCERKNRKREAQNNCQKIFDTSNSECTTNSEYVKYFKRCFELKPHDIDECCKLLFAMGIPFIRAPREADAQCAAIAKYYSNRVAGVISDDSDILLYGCTKLYKNISIRKNQVEDIGMDSILSYLQEISDHTRKLFGMEKMAIVAKNFTDICILLGTEYNKKSRIIGLRPIELVMLYVINNGNVKNTICAIINFDSENIFVQADFMDLFNLIKKEYEETKVIHPKNIMIDHSNINEIVIRKILDVGVFDESYIDYGIRSLKKYRVP